MGGADPSLRRRVGRWVSLVLSPAYNHEDEASIGGHGTRHWPHRLIAQPARRPCPPPLVLACHAASTSFSSSAVKPVTGPSLSRNQSKGVTRRLASGRGVSPAHAGAVSRVAKPAKSGKGSPNGSDRGPVQRLTSCCSRKARSTQGTSQDDPSVAAHAVSNSPRVSDGPIAGGAGMSGNCTPEKLGAAKDQQTHRFTSHPPRTRAAHCRVRCRNWYSRN
jgi:hypothetical protein